MNTSHTKHRAICRELSLANNGYTFAAALSVEQVAQADAAVAAGLASIGFAHRYGYAYTSKTYSLTAAGIAVVSYFKGM